MVVVVVEHVDVDVVDVAKGAAAPACLAPAPKPVGAVTTCEEQLERRREMKQSGIRRKKGN